MIRSATSKVMWVGRATVFMVGLAVMLALVLGVATTALASIPGDPFRLGQTNGIDAMSTLVGNVAGTMLMVDNNSTGAGATALDLRVEAGKAPMKVNSGAKVGLLNADKVDGKDATAFYAAGSKVVDSSHADQADLATSAADANTLDGLDSIALQRRVGTACDPGSSIRAISEDGTPTCEPDDDTSATQVNALKTELGANDNTPNEPSDPVSYSKVKDIPADVVNRNADTLDGENSTAFLGASQKAADSELLDGKNSTEFAAAYKRTVVVSPVGTDTQNGQALLNALSNIQDASATKPYLLYIEPGTYDLGSGSLAMKQHVDIQGAGELNTIIASVVASCSAGTVKGASNAELRFLTVRNLSTGSCGVGVYNGSSASPLLTHVRAESTGAGGSGRSDHFGVFNQSSNPTMTNVTATASGGTSNFGVFNSSSSNPTMTNVTATASGGTSNYAVFNSSSSNPTMTNVTATASGGNLNIGVLNSFSSNPTISHSRLSGGTYSLHHDGGSSGTAKVALTQLVGPVTKNSGTLQCFNNYNENMAAVTCP